MEDSHQPALLPSKSTTKDCEYWKNVAADLLIQNLAIRSLPTFIENRNFTRDEYFEKIRQCHFNIDNNNSSIYEYNFSLEETLNRYRSFKIGAPTSGPHYLSTQNITMTQAANVGLNVSEFRRSMITDYFDFNVMNLPIEHIKTHLITSLFKDNQEAFYLFVAEEAALLTELRVSLLHYINFDLVTEKYASMKEVRVFQKIYFSFIHGMLEKLKTVLNCDTNIKISTKKSELLHTTLQLKLYSTQRRDFVSKDIILAGTCDLTILKEDEDKDILSYINKPPIHTITSITETMAGIPNLDKGKRGKRKIEKTIDPKVAKQFSSEFLHSSCHIELKSPISNFFRDRACALKDQLIAETILLRNKRKDLLDEVATVTRNSHWASFCLPYIVSILTDGFVLYLLFNVNTKMILTSSVVDASTYIMYFLFACFPGDNAKIEEIIANSANVYEPYISSDEGEGEKVQDVTFSSRFSSTEDAHTKLYFKRNDDGSSDDGDDHDTGNNNKKMRTRTTTKNQPNNSQVTSSSNNSNTTTKSKKQKQQKNVEKEQLFCIDLGTTDKVFSEKMLDTDWSHLLNYSRILNKEVGLFERFLSSKTDNSMDVNRQIG